MDGCDMKAVRSYGLGCDLLLALGAILDLLLRSQLVDLADLPAVPTVHVKHPPRLQPQVFLLFALSELLEGIDHRPQEHRPSLF